MAEAPDLKSGQCGFESHHHYHPPNERVQNLLYQAINGPVKTRTLMANIEDPAAQIIILERIKRSIAPMCGVLQSANWRDRARKIYNVAKELQDEIRKNNS